jgi:hypothetical protein
VSERGRLGIGPSSREFREAFDVGADDDWIHPVDGIGVSLAAIQGLNETIREQARELAQLRQRVAAAEAAAASRP